MDRSISLKLIFWFCDKPKLIRRFLSEFCRFFNNDFSSLFFANFLLVDFDFFLKKTAWKLFSGLGVVFILALSKSPQSVSSKILGGVWFESNDFTEFFFLDFFALGGESTTTVVASSSSNLRFFFFWKKREKKIVEKGKRKSSCLIFF